MEFAPPECRKSLDQLLEQALAERSREDDQVEVTYELTDNFVRDQRGLRLKPDNTSISSRNRDDDEGESEDTMGSVQMEKKVMRNTILLSIAVVFISSGFVALQSLQTTAFPSVGLLSLSVLYFSATLSCFFSAPIVLKAGIKVTIACVSLFHALYVLIFHYYHPAAFIIASMFFGLSLGPMIKAQKTYLTQNMSRLSYMTQSMRNKIQQRFLRFFFVISKSHFFWGHLVATIVLEYGGEPTDSTTPLLNSTDSFDTVIKHTELCYERLCENGIYPMERDKIDRNASSEILSKNATRLFIFVFVPCIMCGVLAVLFLENIEAMLEQDPMERPLIYQTFRQIRLIFVDKNVRLALPMLMFIGVEQAFIFGDFTRAYISCALGLTSVGFTMMCLGGAHILGSVGVHLFSQHFQRPIIMAAGLVCQSGLLMVLWLWTPVEDDAAVFYVIAGGWGLCNTIWETLTLTFLATSFADDWQVPFCTYYQLQWFGMAVTFSISPFFCAEVKILILAVFLAVAIIPYTILEFKLHERNLVQNRTDML